MVSITFTLTWAEPDVARWVLCNVMMKPGWLSHVSHPTVGSPGGFLRDVLQPRNERQLPNRFEEIRLCVRASLQRRLPKTSTVIIFTVFVFLRLTPEHGIQNVSYWPTVRVSRIKISHFLWWKSENFTTQKTWNLKLEIQQQYMTFNDILKTPLK